jgi:hypothetical protein
MRILWLVKEEKQHGSAQVIVGGHYALLQAAISLFINPNSAPFPRFFDRAIVDVQDMPLNYEHCHAIFLCPSL